MSKELLELLDSINRKKEEVKNLVQEGKIPEAKSAKEELKALQEKFDLLKDLEDQAADQVRQAAAAGTARMADGEDVVHAFADAARHGFRVQDSMSEGTPADGGYTVPEDIQTRINTYREARESLIDLVDVEPVSTNKGSRTFKKRSQQTGFAKVAEGGKIGGKATPQFERMDYNIEKYAGWFPVTNELQEDSDAVTVIGSQEKTVLTGLDDIKLALNVTLGAAFKATSRIVTNDDGLQYLDTLKDKDGKYLLQPVPSEPMKMRLCAGATMVEVKVYPNADLPSDTSTAGKRGIPFIIGDLKEGIKFFDRRHLTILASNLAQAGDLNAFEQDLTLFRAIEREDCKVKDAEAFVNGELVIDDASVKAATAK